MLHLPSVWLAIVFAALTIASHAVAVIGGPTAVLTTVADTTTAIRLHVFLLSARPMHQRRQRCLSRHQCERPGGDLCFGPAPASGYPSKSPTSIRPIAGGSGTFVSFPDAACPLISGQNLVFVGNGAGG